MQIGFLDLKRNFKMLKKYNGHNDLVLENLLNGNK